MERYSRQVRFSGIQVEGQNRLAQSRVMVCGCGALGTAVCEALVRAGVGFIRIVDRDFVELSNLQRQVLFDELDATDRLPKAIAAANKLRAINSTVIIEPQVASLNASNIEQLGGDCHLWLDGTDNFETRFLLNDAALEMKRPWIYAGVVGSTGQTMTIIPGQTACLRCLMDGPPAPGTSATCDSAGVIGPAVSHISSLQSAAALRWLASGGQPVASELIYVDVWERSWRRIDTQSLFDSKTCPACHQNERLWLNASRTTETAVLCGRNSVQISPAENRQVDFNSLERQWNSQGQVVRSRFLLRLTPRDTFGPQNGAVEIHLFSDGRAIIQGTDDVDVALVVYARFVGT